ncbi:sulfite exporter TauE/SafE family protein [Siminovitchia sediminis]|uniref:Probable membrane transporter protein n=1 Tax=Siminovitchia sediminis TaxID=1274353 RepID=A0ABW4KEG5_9BACI
MWLISLAIGLLAGILTGMISVGGGVIVTSLLILFTSWLALGLNMKEIAMTTSIYTVFSTLSGAVYYYTQKLVQLKAIVYFGAPALLSSLIFSQIANTLSDELLKGIFAFFSIVATISILLPKKETSGDQEENYSLVLSVLLSIGVGAVGGLIGVAAGFLYMPIFIRMFGMPVKKAVGTGLLVGMMLASGTILGKFGGNYFRLDLTVPLILGGVAGVYFGGKMASFMKDQWLKVMMAVAIIGVTIQVLFEYLYHTLQISLSLALIVLTVVFVMILAGTYMMGRPQRANEGITNKSSKLGG